jgi:hypothetical protein
MVVATVHNAGILSAALNAHTHTQTHVLLQGPQCKLVHHVQRQALARQRARQQLQQCWVTAVPGRPNQRKSLLSLNSKCNQQGTHLQLANKRRCSRSPGGALLHVRSRQAGVLSLINTAAARPVVLMNVESCVLGTVCAADRARVQCGCHPPWHQLLLGLGKVLLALSHTGCSQFRCMW